jgi:aspartate/methionine/tyrosine aminotransferase
MYTPRVITPFELERYFAPYEHSVPFTLASSDCESVSIRTLLELSGDGLAAREQLLDVWLGYTESDGAPSLREAIVASYRRSLPRETNASGVTRDHVLVHTGAQEAIHNFVRAVLEPADHVVAQYPAYQSSFQVARDMGCQVELWRARETSTGYSFDLDELQRLLRPETRVVFVNTPHNPTGWHADAEFWRALFAMADRHGFLVFSDEVYRHLEHDPKDRLVPAAYMSPLGVSLGVVSKAHGLPGLRIGWIATQHEPVLDAMRKAKDYTSICNPAPSEFLAQLALTHESELTARCRARVVTQLPMLRRAFDLERFAHYAPQAGPIAFFNLTRSAPWGDASAFADDVRSHAGVLVLPGVVYGAEYTRCFRVGFGRASLPEALTRLERFLEFAGKLG